jgi:hypothetical protein
MYRLLIHPWRALLSVLLAAATSCATASLAHYGFSLQLTETYGVNPLSAGGSGSFSVDMASVPLLGFASVAATHFEGTVDHRPFGYSQGNTLTIVTPEGSIVDWQPATPASILFQDHAAVGIFYRESHGFTSTIPEVPVGGGLALSLGGATWQLQQNRGGGGGAIMITVPEPGTYGLLLAGLGLLGFAARRHRASSV